MSGQQAVDRGARAGWAEHAAAISAPVLAALAPPGRRWWAALGLTGAMVAVGAVSWAYQIACGMGVTNKNNPVGWGTYITDFVFWVGIAHAGTLLSAVLFLFRARFRAAFSRAAEAMTLAAICVAGLFPLVHLGRVQFFYWLVPYPNQRLLWPNVRSALMWDVLAISAYIVVSAFFLWIGLIPDLASARRHVGGARRWLYGLLALGWTGALGQWRLYGRLYGLLAGFATALVFLLSSVVSWDFATGVIPGWHATVFPPYFVAGAIFSGLGMVLVIGVPLRRLLGLQALLTVERFESLAKLLVLLSLVVSGIYLSEWGLAFYSGNVFEQDQLLWRLQGHYRPWYLLMLACNSLVPLLLLVRPLRRRLGLLFAVGLAVNVGMYLERFFIIAVSLTRDFDPYSWGLYWPSPVEIGVTVGSFGLFFSALLLFTRLVPIASLTELLEPHHDG